MVQSTYTRDIPALPSMENEKHLAPAIVAGTPIEIEHLRAAWQQYKIRTAYGGYNDDVAAADIRFLSVKLEHEAARYPGGAGQQQILQQLLQGQKDLQDQLQALKSELKDVKEDMKRLKSDRLRD
jgi:hypothetical protein